MAKESLRDFGRKVKAFLRGQRAPRPEPVVESRPRAGSVQATAEPGFCARCGKWACAGWLIDGKLVCNLDARPEVREFYGLKRDQAPMPTVLAPVGDPR